MILFPAIDLYEGSAVRLYKGDYEKMTVYSRHPERIALDFVSKGATHIHIVDLEGARDGGTPNLETVLRIKDASGVFCEIGGGVRSIDVVRRYLDAGLDRVILGTAAVKDPAFLRTAVKEYGEKIAVGVDIRDGTVAVSGWRESSHLDAMAFCREMETIGVRTLICTDISKDGAMEGTNRRLYEELRAVCSLQIVASGGVSTLEDVKYLAGQGLYGAIIGKAYYTGAVDLRQAIEVAM